MAAPVAAGVQVNGDGSNAPADLKYFVFALFFIFGGITSLNDVLIPKLKDIFTLSYSQAMLTQSAFFAAYFVVSLPAGGLVRRIGYMRTAAFGLLLMTAGCLAFIPASYSAAFPAFLAALFVLAAGITIVQVVANPLISMLGAPSTAHSRLTFAQAFNSLGTTIMPYVGAMLILGSLANVDSSTLDPAALATFRAEETQVVVHTYIGLAVALVAVALLVWARRNRLQEARAERVPFTRSFELLKRPRFAFGTLGIFLYVGAEVAIGSLIVNYLMQARTLGLDPQSAGEHVAFYWGGAMVGRFVGAYVLRLVAPGKVLATAASIVIALLLISANSTGAVAGWSLLAIGLFNSIMFPTIFSLASEGLGERAPEGSGLLATAIVGGAIVPPITGSAADTLGLAAALTVPAICYAGIASFGWYARRPAVLAPVAKPLTA
ncbi:glucose/galactose MFS transporter [Sphingomonas oleivorans]|uniref:Glucose/galactose MFS transporter n=1 Tax=Sphingomonas oleivorans TaxID=1735121 RepID=A0A2T5G2A6_9SPHN|nr:sugar MFS transporter [Sphingomonas oleivorans]PTQ13274.1 glucose/galactose MFS transporter [Sphingomonas oleivorans]